MFKSLTMRNFKSWREIEHMRLAPITGLFGENSSGKTSILQLLLLMKQTAESADRAQVLDLGSERSPVSLGSYRDIVFGHKLQERISWSVDWLSPTSLEVASPTGNEPLLSGNEFGLDVAVRYRLRNIRTESVRYRFAGYRFSMSPLDERLDRYKLRVQPETFRLKRTLGRHWDLPAPDKFYGFPDQVKAYYQNAGFLSDLQLSFEDLLARTYYLGPLRKSPQRIYTWSGAQPEDVGHQGERAVEALLAARARKQMISRGRGHPRLSLQEMTAQWLRDLDLIHSFSVASVKTGSGLYQVRVRKEPRSALVLITDIGFGVSQVLPVLVLCYYVPRGSVVILEQPEIHLHPKVQAGLADVFIDAVKTRGIQILLESHSEHLVNRLQLRLGEGKITPADTALYFCERNEGESRLKELDVDMFGNISNWPRDFFGSPLKESAARLEAEIRRIEEDQVS
jgi:predicted ATPase